MVDESQRTISEIPRKSVVSAELLAMQRISDALLELESEGDESVMRVLGWINASFNKKKSHTTSSIDFQTESHEQGQRMAETLQPVGSFTSSGDLFETANPAGEFGKAVVMGYWFQIVKGGDSFTGQQVNNELKQLGLPVKNITDAFNTAKERTPALVMQVQKSGSSRQARKLYRLTQAGIKWVDGLLKEANVHNDPSNEF